MPWSSPCLESCWTTCFKKKSGHDVRRQSVAEAEKRLETLEEQQVKKRNVMPPAKYLPLTFVPDIVVKEILNDKVKTVPYQIYSKAIILIADVCGFTSLTESYCQKGVSGIEELASVLNGYMSTLAAMLLAADGDILNFAGDAFLVCWEVQGEEEAQVIEKVFNCALSLQTHECLQTKNLEGTLKVKIGIASGKIVTWILGTLSEFLLFVVAGPGLGVVHKAEEMCEPEDVIISQDIYSVLKSNKDLTFTATELQEGYMKISDYIPAEGPEPYPIRTDYIAQCQNEQIEVSKLFSIPGVRDVSRVSELNYLSELTMVTILFIAMSDIPVEEPKILDKTFDIILRCAKKQGGVLNKMLLFDKGCTYLVVFGLPGQKHADDAARGLLCATDIIEKHAEIHVDVSIGVTSGTCFCGIVGHPQRQEYTVIGNRVNLAARLMVVYGDQSIVLDSTTFHLTQDVLGESSFVPLPNRKMKGIESAGQIYTYRLSDPSNGKDIEENSLRVVETESIITANANQTEKDRIKHCLRLMSNPNERSDVLSSKLLPVIILEGPTGSGRSYYMYFAAHEALQLGYRIAACCIIPSYINNPFSTVAVLIQHMLCLKQTDTVFQREQKILKAFSHQYDPQFYLLNHLFQVQFPIPKIVNINEDFRIKESIRLFKTMFQQYSEGHSMIIAIDDADGMDDNSWKLVQELTTENNFLLLLSLRKDFKEPSISASLLILKAHTHIKVSTSLEENYASLVCWFLGVKAVNKVIYHFLKEKTKGNTQLLKEVLLSPLVTQYMEFVPLESLENARKTLFLISEFPVPENEEGNVFICDTKAGANLKNMSIPANINESVNLSLNYLSVQDRLLLKQAALIEEDFNQHILEAASAGLTSKDVVLSINNLMSHSIFISACTSEVILERVPAQEESSQLLECYNICFCARVTSKSVFNNYKKAHIHIGPYHRLKFRTNEFRLCIMSSMTNEQNHMMHLEIVEALETNGLLCMSCKAKKLEATQVEGAMGDIRGWSTKLDMRQCACLHRRPMVYTLIGHIYDSVGDKLLPAYFTKQAAQASNHVHYPIQALNYAAIAEKLLPHQSDAFIMQHMAKEESNFDLLVLRASVKKTQALSSLLLGNAYCAASFIQKALEILGLDTVHLYGTYSPNEFRHLLERYPLLQAEFITKTIGVLSQTYILAEKYDLALMVLDIEFVALSYYPIDFLQILNFMISLYQCKNQMKPERKFRSLEDNTLRICHGRLRNFDTTQCLLEIQGIGSAYILLIEMNLKKGHLSRAEDIAQEALKVMKYTGNHKDMLVIYINLIEIYLHQDRYMDCFSFLENLDSSVDDSTSLETWALYACALSHLMVLKLTGEPRTTSDQSRINQCNRFAYEWTERTSHLIQSDVSVHTAVMMSTWSLKSGELCNWPDADMVFARCYDIASTLYKEQDKESYWNVGANLIRLRIRMKLAVHSNDVDGTRSSIMEELDLMKQSIKTYFPVYREKYKSLKKDLNSLEPKEMLNSF